MMRFVALAALLTITGSVLAKQVSRLMTHYVPQDLLVKAIRTEGWTEVPMKTDWKIKKGDTIRVFAGGLVDRGNGDQPGIHTAGPEGVEAAQAPADLKTLALSPDARHAFALLVKTESGTIHSCLPAGKTLEVPILKDDEKLLIGFNDLKGKFSDNHLGKGRRHEHEPLWVRLEQIRIEGD